MYFAGAVPYLRLKREGGALPYFTGAQLYLSGAETVEYSVSANLSTPLQLKEFAFLSKPSGLISPSNQTVSAKFMRDSRFQGDSCNQENSQ